MRFGLDPDLGSWSTLAMDMDSSSLFDLRFILLSLDLGPKSMVLFHKLEYVRIIFLFI